MPRNLADALSGQGIQSIELNPGKFYALIKLAQEIEKDKFKLLDAFVVTLEAVCEKIDEEADGLAKANNDFLAEVRHMTRRKNPFAHTEEADDPFADLRHTVDGQNFLRVIFDVVSLIQRGFNGLYATARGVRPTDFVLSKNKRDGAFSKFGIDTFDTTEDMQKMLFEVQLNQGSLQRFIDGLGLVDGVKNSVVQIARIIGDKLEAYYQALIKRHSNDGILVHGDPVTTDIAMTIFENVDAHGEIQDGKKPDEISAYSVRKATIVADAVRNGIVGNFIKNPDLLLKFIEDNLKSLWNLASEIHDMFKPTADKAKSILGFGGFKRVYEMPDAEFSMALTMLKDLDPRTVTFKEKTGLQTPEERYKLKFQNETLKEVTFRLLGKGSTQSLIQYILERKAELRDFYLEENSFYVCKMGSGNPFSGEAPGALTVVPGTRPIVNLDEIIGEGFPEVKAFMGVVEKSSRWHDIFVATSPSRTADKSNVLLIGPQGCHRKGQKVLLHDGTLLAVEDVHVGDRLMGPDSTPRDVLELHTGVEEMVEIIPTKGEPWVVNKGHILTLVRMGRKKFGGQIKDVSVAEYMTWSTYMKREYKLLRVSVDFAARTAPLPLDPYFVGLLLGDGSITTSPGLTTGDEELVQEIHVQAGQFGLRVTPSPDPTSSVTRYYLSGTQHHLNPIMSILRDLGLGGKTTATKFIPHEYKTASRADRLCLLAGVMDTDGGLDACFDFQNKSRALAHDVTFVARSLGFGAYVKPFTRLDSKGTPRPYYRVKISGDISQIPTRLAHKQARKRRQIKDVLRTGFTTRDLPSEEYFGFTLNGDHRYLLDDFTVNHNCGKTEILRAVGGDKKSIGVFATGSDFLTCWKGEAERNPKRLFEACLELQRESKKHVHILIDEIDTILSKDTGRDSFGATNLVTEFQNLMDGVVHYPHISVWGATNNPERLPMPILRRFAKVWIVGELNQDHRVKLLQHFTSFMPVHDGFNAAEWTKAAETLDGATGDVIRKIVDYVWREKMGEFVSNHHEVASKAIDMLNTDGVKFAIHEFDDKKRRAFHDMIRPFVNVTPEDLHRSIDQHLGNVAIHHEIRTAQETYNKSRSFLATIKRNGVQGPAKTAEAQA